MRVSLFRRCLTFFTHLLRVCSCALFFFRFFVAGDFVSNAGDLLEEGIYLSKRAFFSSVGEFDRLHVRLVMWQVDWDF
jgi:hypothetical protein